MNNFLKARVLFHLYFKGESNVQEIAKALNSEVDVVFSALDVLLKKGLVAECTYCFKNADGEIAYVSAWTTERVFKERRANW